LLAATSKAISPTAETEESMEATTVTQEVRRKGKKRTNLKA
jgi:hypothetical protein